MSEAIYHISTVSWSVRPYVISFPFYLIVLEITIVFHTIYPFKNTLSC